MNTKKLIETLNNYHFKIFDFDDTIVSLQTDWSALRRELVASLKKNYNFDGTHWRIHEMVNKATQKHGKIVKDRVQSLFLKYEKGSPFSFNSVLVKHLQCTDLWAVFSNNCHSSIESVLQKLSLQPSLIVGYEDVEYFKPESCGLKKILKHFDLSSQDVVFVGDKDTDKEQALKDSVPFIKILPQKMSFFHP